MVEQEYECRAGDRHACSLHLPHQPQNLAEDLITREAACMAMTEWRGKAPACVPVSSLPLPALSQCASPRQNSPLSRTQGGREPERGWCRCAPSTWEMAAFLLLCPGSPLPSPPAWLYQNAWILWFSKCNFFNHAPSCIGFPLCWLEFVFPAYYIHSRQWRKKQSSYNQNFLSHQDVWTASNS